MVTARQLHHFRSAAPVPLPVRNPRCRYHWNSVLGQEKVNRSRETGKTGRNLCPNTEEAVGRAELQDHRRPKSHTADCLTKVRAAAAEMDPTKYSANFVRLQKNATRIHRGERMIKSAVP
ncbi:hypothetical protein KCU88_g327, partial [Aureobasidium melanogenum]